VTAILFAEPVSVKTPMMFKLPPQKRYNNYNIFFMLERQLILHTLGGGEECSMLTLQNQRLQAIETGENKTSNKVVGGNLKGNTMKTTSQNYYDSIQDVRPLMTMLHATSLGTTSLGTTSLGRSINSGTAAIRTCT
jgi:hypothetical protein